MSKDTKKAQVSIDGVDYLIEDMTQQQQILLNHILDLERKLESAKFSVDQLQVGRDAFLNLLKQSLAESKAAEPISDVTPKTETA